MITLDTSTFIFITSFKIYLISHINTNDNLNYKFELLKKASLTKLQLLNYPIVVLRCRYKVKVTKLNDLL